MLSCPVVAPPSARAQHVCAARACWRTGGGAAAASPSWQPRALRGRVTVSYVLLGPAWSLTLVAIVACG